MRTDRRRALREAGSSRRRCNRNRGLTMLELLIAASILAATLALFHFAVFGGGRSYARARARLDVIAACRAALELVRADVQRAVSSVQVSDDGAELVLRILSPATGGLPVAGPDGKFDELEVKYRYDAVTRRLSRNGEVAGRDLPDVEFSQSVREAGPVRYPSISCQVTAILDGRPVGIRMTAVPRVMAGWSSNPGWVFTGIGAPYDFKVEQ